MANEKVVGKELQFWFNGLEEPVISVKPSESFGTEDSTDTATPGDGKDFEVILAERSFTVEQNFYTPIGAEINTGTLTADARYRVTAKDTVLAAYDIGEIFEADGTETMSATDKVVPLGTKITGKTMGLSFDSVDVPLTDVDININYDELDVTDTETTGDGTEYITSRAERESKASIIMRSEDVDLLTTNPTNEATVLTFASGQTFTGSAIPISKEITDESTGVSKVDYAFKWKGAPTEVACGLATAVEHAFKIIFKRGASTNKEITGNAIITKKSITVSRKGLAKISYTFRINGTPTYAVAN
jgi:hypothetical protein